MRSFLIAFALLLPMAGYADEERMSREDLLIASNLWLQAQLAMERRAAVFAKYKVQLAADGTPIGVDQDGAIHRPKPPAPTKPTPKK